MYRIEINISEIVREVGHLSEVGHHLALMQAMSSVSNGQRQLFIL
jgi:hypothetical protein